jgi:hypothetical protein
MTSDEESGLGVAADGGLTLIASSCGAGSCPAVYRTSTGTFVIQGFAVDAEGIGVELAEGELLVEIPAGLLAEVLRSQPQP